MKNTCKRILAIICCMAMMITAFSALGFSVAAEGEYFTITANNRNLFLNVDQEVALSDISVVINDVALSGNDVIWTSSNANVDIGGGILKVLAKGTYVVDVMDADGNEGTVTVIAKNADETEYVLYEQDFEAVANGELPEGWTEAENADVVADEAAQANFPNYIDKAQVIDGKLYIGNGANNGYNYVWLPEFLDSFGDYEISVDMAQTWVNDNMRAGGIVTRGNRTDAGAHPAAGYRIFIRRGTTGASGMRLTSLAKIDNAGCTVDKALPFPIGSTRAWSRPDCTVEHWDPNQQPSPWYTPAESTAPGWKGEGYVVTWEIANFGDSYTINAYKPYEQPQFGGDMGPGGGGAWWETYWLKDDPALEGYEMEVDTTNWAPEHKAETGAIGLFTSGVQLAVESIKVTVPVAKLAANPDKYVKAELDPALATYESQKIGVMSDVHLQVGSTPADYALKNALTNMKNDGVSAVLFTGDLVNTGIDEEYEKFNAIWDEVMGDTDVKKLTISGNHEFEGVHFRGENYDDLLDRYMNAFGLEEANFHDVVNGIHVIGINSEDAAVDGKYTMDTTDWLVEQLDAALAENPYGPIIVMCHQTIKGTTYGSEWGSSATAELNNVLRYYPQVIYLAGHSHFDFTNEKSIMQKDFTTIDVPSLQYTSTENGIGGSNATEYEYQNYLMLEIDGESKTMSVKRMKSYEKEGSKEHEYETVQVKEPWVLNLPLLKKSDFTYTAVRAEDRLAPTFAEGTAIEVSNVTSTTATIKYPAASHDDYVHAYNVVVTDAAGSPIQSKYFVSDFYRLGDKQAEYAVDLEGLPSNTRMTISVTAMESFGKISEPISVEIVTDPISTPSVGSNVADFLDVNTAVGFTDSSPYRRSHSLYVKSHPIKLQYDETLGRQVASMKGWVNYPVSQGDFKEITNSFTIELAFKTPAEAAKSQCIFGNPESGGMTVEFNGNGLFQVGAFIQGAESGGYKYITVPEALDVDTWYHIVYAFDGETSVLYLNGEKVGSVDFAGYVKHNPNVNFLTIGANVNAVGNAAYTYQGSVAIARVYTDALMDASQAKAALKAFENDNMINALYQKWLTLYNAKENYALNATDLAAVTKLMTQINLAIHSTALTEEIANDYIAEVDALLINLMKYDLKAPYVLFEDNTNDYTKIHSGSNYNGLQWENNTEIKQTLFSKQNNNADHYLIYKLPGNVSEVQVDALSVSVYDKDYTSEDYSIFVSEDGENWTQVSHTASAPVPNAITPYWNEVTLTAKVDGDYNYVKVQFNVYGTAIDENGDEVARVNWSSVVNNIRVWYAEEGVEIPDPNFATITKESSTAAYAQMGKNVKVSISAEGDGLTYQWYIKNANGTKYSKSSIIGSTYTAEMTDKVKGRRVYCVVTDKYGSTVQSKTFILRQSVSILTQPKHTKVANGKVAKVTVKASGDGLKYTWYVKNAGETKYTKSKVTSATYSVTMSKKVDGRRLICYVTDKYGNKVQCETVKLSKK